MSQDMNELAEALRSVVSVAAQAVGRTLPVAGELSLGEPTLAGPVPVPGPGARAVTARMGGALTGDVVLAVSAEVVAAIEHGPVGAQELVPALEPALADAIAVLEEAAGAEVRVESLREVEADVAFSGAEIDPFAAVTLHQDGAHAATFALVLQADEPAHETSVPTEGPLDPITASAAAPGVVGPTGSPGSLEMLNEVEMGVTAELGRTRMTVRDLLGLTPGSIVELDRAAGSPVDVLVNGTLVAKGEVVVIDEEFGIRISEIVAAGDVR